jgi:hypothetical protein
MKFYFTLTSGCFSRNNIRQQLNNSKSKLEHWYPGCRVLLTENKGLFESEFYFEAIEMPNTAEKHMREWVNKLKQLSNV